MKLVVTRVVHLIVVLFGISVLAFLLVHMLPGDPATSLASESGSVTPALLDEIRKQLGLNLPLYQQYGLWIGNALHGNLGTSYRNNQPVATAIGQHFGVTVQLMIMAQILSLVIAVPVGLYLAPRRNNWVDRVVAGITFALQAIPNYVIAMVGILVFAVTLRWLPAVGYVPLSAGLWPSVASLTIPTVALSALVVSVYIRVLRESTIDTLRMDYMLVGRAMGYSRARLLWKLALKPSLPPLITIAGLQVGLLLGSAVVIEVICGLPGLGTLLLNAIQNRDYTTVQAMVLLFAVVFVVVNFITDMIHIAIDPRVRAAS